MGANASIHEIPSRRPAYGLSEIELSRKGATSSREMRGEISPMIAEASTSTRPKWASQGAKSAEFLSRSAFSGGKTAAAGQFLSRIGGPAQVRGV